MDNEIKVKYLRKSFFEVVMFLTDNQLDYWIARGLLEQINRGIIDDDEKHDIDFHLLAEDKNRLEKLLNVNNYKIRQVKTYKIQVLGKADNRKIEFVFLNKQDNNYIHQSSGILYVHPQKLFGNHTCKIGDVNVNIPWPIEEYINAKKVNLVRS